MGSLAFQLSYCLGGSCVVLSTAPRQEGEVSGASFRHPQC